MVRDRYKKSNLLLFQWNDQYQKLWFKFTKNGKSHKNIDIYYIGYITIKNIDDCENIHSTNPLHLLVNHANGEEKNGNKDLIFDDSVNENKGLLKNT